MPQGDTPKTVSALPPVPGIPVLPANAGAGVPRVAAPEEGPTNATVRAVVTGDHGFALVESGTSMRIVARGDRIAGGVVTAIDAAGVILDSGKHLPLAPLASEDRKARP